MATSSCLNFVLTNSKTSGWSEYITTIRAARRVLPPDFMAPAILSQPLSKESGPEAEPFPAIGSPSLRIEEMFMPTPEPLENMLPSVYWCFKIASIESSTPRIKHALACGFA